MSRYHRRWPLVAIGAYLAKRNARNINSISARSLRKCTMRRNLEMSLMRCARQHQELRFVISISAGLLHVHVCSCTGLVLTRQVLLCDNFNALTGEIESLPGNIEILPAGAPETNKRLQGIYLSMLGCNGGCTWVTDVLMWTLTCVAVPQDIMPAPAIDHRNLLWSPHD
jgi:hypothetical protein